MKKILYFLAALIGFAATSCQEDDVTFNNVDDLDRLPMPMFRKKVNTNVADESDQFASRLMTGELNAIQLHWYGIEGAKEYELRYGILVRDESQWNDESRTDIVKVTVPADQLHYELRNLEYASDYYFSIRAIHPTDPSKNSLWYGIGDTGHNHEYMCISTKKRYEVPTVVMIDSRDKDYDKLTVKMNLTWDRAAFVKEHSELEAQTIEKLFNIVDGKFTPTHLVVQPNPVNPTAAVGEKWKRYQLTPEDMVEDEEGMISIRVDGLEPSSLYNIALFDANSPAEADVDKYFNFYSMRTKGDPGAPILIPHKVATSVWLDPENTSPNMDLENKYLAAEQEFQACRLDTVFSKYISDNTLAEGTTIMLEGGKAYYLRQGPNLNKGFTLCTDPADIAAGKGRAKIYMGGIVIDGNAAQVCNWNFGKVKETGEFAVPILVEKCIFRDIDFSVPKAINFGDVQAGVGAISANYWANNLSGTLPFEYEGIECYNCTFQGAQRGFFRAQGAAKKVINKIVFDNCVFMNLGMYNANGMDYRFIHGEQTNEADNIAKDIQITNSTFYDCTLSHMISPIKDKVIDFSSEITWSVRIENNTFINLSTRAGRPFINMRSFPGDSRFIFKRNLICLAKDAADNRDLKQGGIDLRPVISGSGNAYFDVRDNYSTGCLDAHMTDDGIFTSGKLSDTKNSFGYYAGLGMLDPALTADDLIVRVGATPLRTDELFADPNPKYHAAEPA
ncbi:MAG: hypothetical protein K2K77_05030, partial [Duncaniella sp.]|nr:hypothetical protein [Duncaniella sp.]